MKTDPSIIMGVVTSASAILAFLLSIKSYYISKKALMINVNQEERRAPRLNLYIQNGYMNRKNEYIVYAFLLSVSNPTDSDNALSVLDLHITYEINNGVLMTAKVPFSQKPQNFFHDTSCLSLLFPLRLDAHQTVAGWVFFEVRNNLLNDVNINSYSIVVTDSHGMRNSIEPCIIQEHHDEIISKKNK